MSAASVTYQFTANTNAQASQVNTDFSDVVNYINTNCIVKDGTLAMTGQLSLAGDPTIAAHAARKGYVDKYKTQVVSGLPGAGNWVSGDIIQTLTITDPGYNILVWVAGSVLALANTLSYWEIQCIQDGVKTGGIIIPQANVSTGQTYAVLGRPTQHNTGTNCSVQLKAVNYSGGGGFVTLANTGANNLFTAWYTAA